MHLPTIATVAVLTAEPGTYCRVAREFATAFAAMDTVPSEDMRLCVISLPNWNIQFSIPLGIPMRNMLPMIFPSGRYLKIFVM